MEQIHHSSKRIPTILPYVLAWNWLLGDLDEAEISKIAAFQFPSTEMESYTIAKDFREALDPTAAFIYEDLPALEIS